jgi:hypothetical protein
MFSVPQATKKILDRVAVQKILHKKMPIGSDQISETVRIQTQMVAV